MVIKDKKYALKKLIENEMFFTCLSEELRNDKEIVFELISKRLFMLNYVSKEYFHIKENVYYISEILEKNKENYPNEYAFLTMYRREDELVSKTNAESKVEIQSQRKKI